MRNDLSSVRSEAETLFEQGCGYKKAARILGQPVSRTKYWKRYYNANGPGRYPTLRKTTKGHAPKVDYGPGISLYEAGVTSIVSIVNTFGYDYHRFYYRIRKLRRTP